MTDLVKQARELGGFSPEAELCSLMADEIERLREAIRQADYVFELIAPENHSQTTDSELASLLSSVGEKLSEMVATWDNAALGEKK